jgi:hypothetical protein
MKQSFSLVQDSQHKPSSYDVYHLLPLSPVSIVVSSDREYGKRQLL